jgi:hypothetical protein
MTAAEAGNEHTMQAILIDHARRYPGWTLDDVYKLIHQVAMGSEHAGIDESKARMLLGRELAQLGPGPDEPLIDPISPDGRIVRVHLRPFARLLLPQASLLDAFLRTAREVPPSTERLARYIEAVIQLAEEGKLSFACTEARTFMAEMQAGGFQAIHHSREYVHRYRPAYRVLAREVLPNEILSAGTLAGARSVDGRTKRDAPPVRRRENEGSRARRGERAGPRPNRQDG